MKQSVVSGWCEPQFADVREQFELNFAERGETGAALCLIVGGRIVADLRGGWTDAARRLPWSADTLVNVFSVGKGVLAACLARLMGQGLLSADAPVTSYWPQFGAAGKDQITVRQLLSHQAGLPAIRAALPAGSGLDWQLMTSMLAAEEPWWSPGSGHGYHVNTFGFLGGELIRQITGCPPGEYLKRELAVPLGADVHIGLPAAEHHRVAEFFWPLAAPEAAARGELDGGQRAAGEQIAGPRAPGEQMPGHRMALSAYFNPPDFSGTGIVNTPAWRSAQIPSANMHATAAGVSRIYAALAAGGTLGGIQIVPRGALAAATEQQVYGHDLVLERPSRFGLGFQLTHPERPFGRGESCFGHFGAGGSVGFCDPDADLAFGYVTNQMGPRWRNPRNTVLMDSCYACLE
jgi:CubicO group peptidase (beta-lactamase class C family)